MACGCGKRSERLAAKKAVTASASTDQQQQAGPAIWTGKPAEEAKTNG